jgi:hypothetical protein
MKKLVFFVVCIVLLSTLIITACDLEPGDYKSFEYRLQGTWETNDLNSNSRYFVFLAITSSSITIKVEDYSEWFVDKNDPRCPFKDFAKNVPLKGYSEKIDNNRGIIYIEEFGTLYEIPYEYDSSYISYNRPELLRFTFPSPEAEINRRETLIKVTDDNT